MKARGASLTLLSSKSDVKARDTHFRPEWHQIEEKRKARGLGDVERVAGLLSERGTRDSRLRRRILGSDSRSSYKKRRFEPRHLIRSRGKKEAELDVRASPAQASERQRAKRAREGEYTERRGGATMSRAFPAAKPSNYAKISNDVRAFVAARRRRETDST